MKKINRIWLAAALFLLSATGLNAQVNPKPFVIPELKTWTGETGQFVPTTSTRIVYPKGSAELEKVAKALQADYADMFGTRLEVATGKGKAGDIVLALRKDKKLGAEGYRMSVSDRAVLDAPTPTGVYWATRTLLQISEQSDNHALPCGDVRDWPDYAMRGFMIDCARKFFPIDYLRDYVKIMSYYKMNTFQVHLNDNGFKQYFKNDWDRTYAAFRLESDYFPGLTARDGHYTKQEFRDLQLMAQDRCVEIIPEIDVPAHSLAFAHFRPEVGSEKYGMDHLDLFNPATYNLIDSVFDEYLKGPDPVFIGPRVHVGTDEYSNADTAVVEKFRAFTDHYIRKVESYGKQAMVWGALTHAKGKTPVKSENVIMNCWYNGYAEPKDMAKQGYKLISIPDGYVYIVPAAGYYYDYLNLQMLYDQWSPAVIGNVKFDEGDPVLMGGMFAVWNDHVGNGISTKDVHDRTFPGVQVIAAKAWNGNGKTTVPFDTFNKQRLTLSEAPGVNLAGRIGKGKGLVFEKATVSAGETLPYEEVGYGYRVEFDLDGTAQKPGTELFRSKTAVFYLADPVRGMLGFARDGYLNQFSYPVPEGRNSHIAIEGDNRETRLYIDGKLVETLDIMPIYFGKGAKDGMNYVRTLVFPLRTAGQFAGSVTNLKVYNK